MRRRSIAAWFSIYPVRKGRHKAYTSLVVIISVCVFKVNLDLVVCLRSKIVIRNNFILSLSCPGLIKGPLKDEIINAPFLLELVKNIMIDKIL
jgi:hypothetical protein